MPDKHCNIGMPYQVPYIAKMVRRTRVKGGGGTPQRRQHRHHPRLTCPRGAALPRPQAPPRLQLPRRSLQARLRNAPDLATLHRPQWSGLLAENQTPGCRSCCQSNHLPQAEHPHPPPRQVGSVRPPQQGRAAGQRLSLQAAPSAVYRAQPAAWHQRRAPVGR